MTAYTINQIQAEMIAAGSHWWDRDTMRFFGTRVSEKVYQGPGGVYFVTSEKPPHGSRSYSVRQYCPKDKNVDTVGEFCQLTRSAAHGTAAKLASTPLDEQLDAALCALDDAVTGSANVDCGYGYTHSDTKAESTLALSNYVRLTIKAYDDSSGFYLVLGRNKQSQKHKTQFTDAWALQSEVTRVLGTEPAGEAATIVQAAHVPVGDTEQLTIDIERGGGHCGATHAAYLIRLATQHHQLMGDYCNGVPMYDADSEPLPVLANLRAKIESAAKECECGVIFSGDPRGCTVKLTLPNGETNDWGKEGWCVPTRD